MLVETNRAHRVVARRFVRALTAVAVAFFLATIGATTASATPIDCTPVGVEWIDNQLYYVENCFGYDVYRPL